MAEIAREILPVNLEDEMLKTSANQMDYAAMTSLYSKSLHRLMVAIGKA